MTGRKDNPHPLQEFMVRNRRGSNLKLIPYVGCKSGFSHVFDSLIPDDSGEKIYDVFGGGGGFSFYACKRFGSRNVTYNDHNPVIVNLIKSLQRHPDELYREYQRHQRASDPEYYLKIRGKNIKDGVSGAGRFFYLAKNAFSGKIRFNSRNEFNTPMRKNSKCPQITLESLRMLGDTIRHMSIKNEDFQRYENLQDAFVYLDPPYMNNTNGHYRDVVSLEDFTAFVQTIQSSNKVMISEQNTPDYLRLGPNYHIFNVVLNRSLQYFTQNKSREIIATNYSPAAALRN